MISYLFDVYCRLTFVQGGKIYWPQMKVDVQRHYSKCGADNIEELDLRTNPFQEGGSDGGPSGMTHIGLYLGP